MVVVEQVDQIEVFVNESGTISICQGDKNDNSIVAFPAKHAEAIIEGIRAAVKDVQELREAGEAGEAGE